MNNADKKKGCFVISLDFEMMWGAIDLWQPKDYGNSHVGQVRESRRR